MGPARGGLETVSGFSSVEVSGDRGKSAGGNGG